MILLPGGGVLFTAPTLSATLTNLSDTTKSVTLSGAGITEVGPVQNGTITISTSGRSLVGFPPPVGFRYLIGTFTLVIDANTGRLHPNIHAERTGSAKTPYSRVLVM